MDYSVLFTPFKIGKMEVKNRIVMSPMGTNSSYKDGTKSRFEAEYFAERAKGGAGMIIMGCMPLDEVLAQGSLEGTLDSFTVLPELTSIVEGVHRYGTKIVCQISCGTGRNAFPDTFGNPPMSASAIPSTFIPDVICHAMTLEEIKALMEKYKFAAGLAKDAGYDAVEIHGHAGYLIDQFMSPVWNKRTDEYGGTPENLTRFPREIVQAIRSAVGPDMPIIFRISLDHRFEGGRTIEDSMKLIKLLEEEGVDALDIDAGSYESLDYIFPPSYLGESCMSYVTEPARKAVKIPLLNAGSHDAETAVKLIESGNADFVMMGRALIADPELPNKLMTGHREDVRPCLRCNERCIGNIWNHHTKLGCAINPRTMEEQRINLVKAETPKNVVIIGGGPAGMEAARVAALEGHDVTLFERSNKLGGVMGDICTSSFKTNIKGLTKYYETQLDKLGVDVRLNTEIKGDEIILEECDNIIIGCGSKPVSPRIPGIDGENVVTMLDMHRDHTLVKGDNIIVCGGGESGCDGALELAKDYGKSVTIVEMMDECARDAMFINKISLFAALNKAEVKIITGAKVTTIDKSGLEIEKKDGTKETLKADTIISAFGMRPDLTTVDAVKAKYHTKTRAVGDSKTLGKIGDAVREGFYAAISL